MNKYEALAKSNCNLAWRYRVNTLILRSKMYFDGREFFAQFGVGRIILKHPEFEGYTDWEPVNE